MTATAPSVPALLVSHWQPDWPLDAAAATVALAYVLSAARVRGGWPSYRTAAFFGGIGCALVALQSGVGAFDDRLLSAHMVQHMLLLLGAPLLVLGGHPMLLALRALPPERRRPAARVLKRFAGYARPIPCLAAFYAVLLLTHLPAFYDATLSHAPLHDLEHGLYLVAGLVLWWPIVDADPVPTRRLGGLGRLIYVLAAMPPMALIGAFLNRHPSLFYSVYAEPGHALGVSPITDQQHAGAIMWVVGNTLMVAVGLWVVLAALLAEERRQQSREARATRVGGAGGPA